MAVDYYGTQQQPDACPRCGSTADVRTVQDLVNMYSQMQGQAMNQGGAPYQPGGQYPQGGSGTEAWYGPESGYGQAPRPQTDQFHGRQYDLGQDIFNDAVGAAGRFLGRAIRNRVQKAMEEKVIPAAQARYQQNMQEQMAIAERYPELRACLRDQVVFLAGGTRTVPFTEVSANITQVTLAQADAVVARLRQP
jgi:hypothetical protein